MLIPRKGSLHGWKDQRFLARKQSALSIQPASVLPGQWLFANCYLLNFKDREDDISQLNRLTSYVIAFLAKALTISRPRSADLAEC